MGKPLASFVESQKFDIWQTSNSTRWQGGYAQEALLIQCGLLIEVSVHILFCWTKRLRRTSAGVVDVDLLRCICQVLVHATYLTKQSRLFHNLLTCWGYQPNECLTNLLAHWSETETETAFTYVYLIPTSCNASSAAVWVIRALKTTAFVLLVWERKSFKFSEDKDFPFAPYLFNFWPYCCKVLLLNFVCYIRVFHHAPNREHIAEEKLMTQKESCNGLRGVMWS